MPTALGERKRSRLETGVPGEEKMAAVKPPHSKKSLRPGGLSYRYTCRAEAGLCKSEESGTPRKAGPTKVR